MKNFLKHSITLILLCVSTIIFAQKKKQGYRIEGDEVIFTFDKREYKEITHGTSEYRKFIDNADFSIQKVAVAGTFNDWSRNLWMMKKVDENRYELRKKRSIFIEEFSWEFKFVINDIYWAEPEGDIGNLVEAKSRFGFPLHVYNLKMFTTPVTEEGNTSFYLKGHKNAKKVILSGSFNKWDEQHFEMKKTQNGWYLTLDLRPDVYEYKFIIDGMWVHDEANPNKKLNEFLGFNSIIEVKAYHTFKLRGYKEASQVLLTGSFNDWSEEGFEMIKTTYGWKFTVLLSSGKHQYKFIVDGKWILDPENPVKEYDYHGNVNSVCMVR